MQKLNLAKKSIRFCYVTEDGRVYIIISLSSIAQICYLIQQNSFVKIKHSMTPFKIHLVAMYLSLRIISDYDIITTLETIYGN